ncbi:MAG: hotdog fold thioesterase [Alphaproteobacteria bacterium]|nr:hotdog fold thioesterase [Alphaproteobacteria bacterium]
MPASRSRRRTAADRGVSSESLLARTLLRRDRFARGLGVEPIESHPGRVVLAMTVTRRHLNCFGSAHGGALFTLADTAFGMAANAHAVAAVAIDTHIAFAIAVREGDRLTARATEMSRGRKTAIYRVEIERQDGKTVAVFGGTVYITGRTVSAEGKLGQAP